MRVLRCAKLSIGESIDVMVSDTHHAETRVYDGPD